MPRHASLIEDLESRRLFASTVAGPTASLPDDLVTLASSSINATGVTQSNLLDRLEAAVRADAEFQNKDGAIIDPVEKREIQYATPYFAYAASTLIVNGRGADLLGPAANALSWASENYSKGLASIPDQHGEFYLFPMAKAYKNLKPLVRAALGRGWLERLKTPLDDVLQGIDWNWRTYAMKGAWALYGVGALTRSTAVDFIETSWADKQKGRFTSNSLSQYEDNTSDPDTIAYDYAARANLMYLVTSGYNGDSAADIQSTVMKGNAAGLYLIDPTGQVSNTGRSANHVWNDLVAAVSFERAARVTANTGFTYTATTYHRAAGLAVLSTDRWQTKSGLYQVTKNNEDPALKRGYADYSGLTNYNGYMILHLSELVEEWRGNLGESAMPSETGGYALRTDSDFGTAVANAGGEHVNVALRHQGQINYDQYWTQLGVTRVSEAGWDSRLGTMTGQDPLTKAAFSLAPAIYIRNKWLRLAEVAGGYDAKFTADVTTAELTRVGVTYTPNAAAGSAYPTLYQTLTITRDGVLMSVSTTGSQVGVTLPLLVNDGVALRASVTPTLASTAYRKNGDTLNYLMVDSGSQISDTGTVIQGATGDYKPLLATRADRTSMSVFIYTQKAGESSGLDVQRTMRVNKYNVSSVLGTVTGNTYVGAIGIAGGFGDEVDFDNDGIIDVKFAKPVEWVIGLRKGKPRFVEVDDATTYYHGTLVYGLKANVARRVQ